MAGCRTLLSRLPHPRLEGGLIHIANRVDLRHPVAHVDRRGAAALARPALFARARDDAAATAARAVTLHRGTHLALGDDVLRLPAFANHCRGSASDKAALGKLHPVVEAGQSTGTAEAAQVEGRPTSSEVTADEAAAVEAAAGNAGVAVEQTTAATGEDAQRLHDQRLGDHLRCHLDERIADVLEHLAERLLNGGSAADDAADRIAHGAAQLAFDRAGQAEHHAAGIGQLSLHLGNFLRDLGLR